MKWVTRHHARVNRIATAWLVRRFIDPQAEFLFVPPEQVARVQEEQGAKGFDAPGATYPHQDAKGRCSFEALVDEHCPTDLALQALARIVHCADFPDAPQTEPAAPGLRAISGGFPTVAANDHDALSKASFLYDALYASLAAARR
ncbi:MAG TPA: chromate resistance protein ChrB domain-containing protein [Myxococcales bacterium]|nr:chromate resistance protein ChrB domain-containing protein [Myxococcales bacterium]